MTDSTTPGLAGQQSRLAFATVSDDLLPEFDASDVNRIPVSLA